MKNCVHIRIQSFQLAELIHIKIKFKILGVKVNFQIVCAYCIQKFNLSFPVKSIFCQNCNSLLCAQTARIAESFSGMFNMLLTGNQIVNKIRNHQTADSHLRRRLHTDLHLLPGNFPILGRISMNKLMLHQII